MTASAIETTVAPPPRLFDVPETTRLLRMSRSYLYEQIRAGRLRPVYQGRSPRFSESALRDYIALLEREAAQR